MIVINKMITFRKIKFLRKLKNIDNEDDVQEEVSFKKFNDKTTSSYCYLCHDFNDNDEFNNSIVKISVHKECLHKFTKCSNDICPQLYLNNSPRCDICFEVFCYYHLDEHICNNCSNNYKYRILWAIRNSSIYGSTRLMKFLLDYFPKYKQQLLFY